MVLSDLKPFTGYIIGIATENYAPTGVSGLGGFVEKSVKTWPNRKFIMRGKHSPYRSESLIDLFLYLAGPTPQDVTAVPSYEFSTINWTLPAENFGVIESVNVYASGPTGDVFYKQLPKDATETNCTGLSPFTDYNVSVTTVNAKLNGKYGGGEGLPFSINVQTLAMGEYSCFNQSNF